MVDDNLDYGLGIMIEVYDLGIICLGIIRNYDLGIICFCYGLVLSRIFWNKKRKNVENTDVLIFL